MKGTQAFGEGLAAGTSSLAGTTSGFATTEQNSDIVTLGGFAQQKLAWRDKVFLSAAVRGDDDSNFGNNFKLVTYPSASLSWVIGEEPWFPQSGILSSLRLAHRHRAVRPAPRLPQRHHVLQRGGREA